MEAVEIKSRSMPKWTIIGAGSEGESLSRMKIINKRPAKLLIFFLASGQVGLVKRIRPVTVTVIFQVPYSNHFNVNQFNLAAIKFSILKVLNIRHYEF